MTQQVSFNVSASFRTELGVWQKVNGIVGAVFNHDYENVIDQVKSWMAENAPVLANEHSPRCEAVRLDTHLAHGNTEYKGYTGEFEIAIQYFVERTTPTW